MTGFLICSKCKGYYKLREGESPEDFESCQCGGKLKYSPTHPYPDIVNSDSKRKAGNSNHSDTTVDLQETYITDSDEETPDKVLDYTGDFRQFNNGKISFKYPKNWTIKTLLPEEKFEGHNPDRSIKLTIHRKSDLEDISFEELLEIWEDIFREQNLKITSRKIFKKKNTENFLITGKKIDNQELVKVAGFKFFDFLYYLHFIIKSGLTEKNLAEIDFIINTFHINLMKHIVEGFYKEV